MILKRERKRLRTRVCKIAFFLLFLIPGIIGFSFKALFFSFTVSRFHSKVDVLKHPMDYEFISLFLSHISKNAKKPYDSIL